MNPFATCPHPLAGKKIPVGTFCFDPDVICMDNVPNGGSDVAMMKMVGKRFNFQPEFQAIGFRIHPNESIESVTGLVKKSSLLFTSDN